jgi:hypothetical protein
MSGPHPKSRLEPGHARLTSLASSARPTTGNEGETIRIGGRTFVIRPSALPPLTAEEWERPTADMRVRGIGPAVVTPGGAERLKIAAELGPADAPVRVPCGAAAGEAERDAARLPAAVAAACRELDRLEECPGRVSPAWRPRRTGRSGDPEEEP